MSTSDGCKLNLVEGESCLFGGTTQVSEGLVVQFSVRHVDDPGQRDLTVRVDHQLQVPVEDLLQVQLCRENNATNTLFKKSLSQRRIFKIEVSTPRVHQPL